ncbi:MAG: bifunctional riboflavin kinase/FAD synthetase, partial [Xanthomonadales bacterium]|nr:bifunctional riboflavin kinase/FAD synthetase [Xanthomonadales bacterium]
MRVFRDLVDQNKPSYGAAVTIGNFDGLHRGHKTLIEQTLVLAKAHKLVSTLISFEPLPRQFFDPSSLTYRLQSTTGKLSQLREWGLQQVGLLRFNQALASLSAEDFIQQILIKQLNTRHLIVGEDFRFGKDRRGDIAMLANTGK